MAGGSARQSSIAASAGSQWVSRRAMRSGRFQSVTRAFPRFRDSKGRGPSRSDSRRDGILLSRIITGSLIAALLAGTAGADTLRDALVSAYGTNPTLTGQREALKATDASVAIAKAAGRPRVTTDVSLNRTITQSGLLVQGGKGPTLTAGAQVSVP